MRPRTPLARATALAGAVILLLGACLREGPVAPTRASLDMDEAAVVDSDTGDLVLWPSDVQPPAAATGGGPLLALAGATVPSIRIGVVQSSATIVLGSLADYTIKDKATGVTLMSGTNGSASVTLAAVPEVYIYYQVVCGSVAAVSTRQAQATALAYFTLTENVLKADGTLNCVRLLIGRLPTTSTTAQRTEFKNTLISEGLAASDAFARTITIGNQTVYRVTRGTLSMQSVNPVVVTSNGGVVTIGATATTLRRYRGKGEARINSAALLAGINELPVEDYLYGVVPQELGPVAFPEMEAQKAQAIAARTYALGNFNRRGSDGYDLRATTDDQVYGGYAFEHPVSNQAVDETRGVVATYNGGLIQALFSSTSGGHTSDNEEVFNSAPVPYLRGIVDSDKHYPPGLAADKEAIRNSSDLRLLRQYREHDFETDWASLHRWTFDWTQAELASILATSLGKPVTAVYEINELSRGPSGRVLALEYVTDVGRDTVRKDAIRASLKFINASGGQSNLPSTLFFIEATDDKGHEVRRQSYGATDAPLPAGFRVLGAGFGHGVGMAQTGAVGMAQEGYSYEAILKRYYTGVELETRY
ncbi:MAG: SpoIID/LytB domain-containing protein [Gemmatimonadaceae bacterium]